MSDRPSQRPAAGARGPIGGGPGAVMAAVEKPKDFGATIRTLLGYLRPSWGPIGLVVVFAVASTAFTIAGPRILGNMTNVIVDGFLDRQVYDQTVERLPAGTTFPAGTTGDQVLDQVPDDVRDAIPAAQRDSIRALDFSRRPGVDFAEIRRLGTLLLVLYAVSAAFAYLQGFIMAGVAQRVSLRLRRDIAEKIDRLPLSYFDTRTHGEVLSRVTNDVDTVSQTLNQSLSSIVTSVVTLVGILVLMLTISWQMTLVALVTLPVAFLLIRTIIGRSQRHFIAQQATLGALNGHVEEMFSGHLVMRVSGGERASVATFRGINASLQGSAWRAQFYSGLMQPVMTFVGNLGYVAVAVLGGWLAYNGSLRIGDIQAFIQYLNSFNQPITQAASIANVLQSTAAAAERVFEFLDAPEQRPDVAAPRVLDDVRGAVSFAGVRFGYQPETPILRDLSLDVSPGQRVAIVGPTGAGKTTIVNLLMRFYEVDAGRITVDGVDIREMTRADVRGLFAMVLQDTWLFGGTVEENIAYGCASPTHDEVVAAATAAHADGFIRALPNGYATELNEAADNISQGQKQLLTISRAVLAGKPLLILDEATSSVDTRTEVLIQRAMDELMVGRTSFVIAHRLSTIRNADLILVMENGDIVERGAHDELTAQRGVYARLYASQFDDAA